MYCSNCGNSIPENSKFCSGCGSSLNVNTKDDDNLIKLKKEAKWVNNIDETIITQPQVSTIKASLIMNLLAGLMRAQSQDSTIKDPKPPEDIQYLKCNGTSNIGLCLKKANGCTVYYFLNVNGEIKSKQYDWASQNFVHGYAKVKTGNLYGMVNTQGREVMPTAFSEIEIVDANTLTSYHLIKAKKNGCFGCFDLSGRIVIQFIYENIGKFRNGIVGVKYNGIYKFIDYNSNDVFSFYWDNNPTILTDDKVYINYNNERFYIDEKGKLFLKGFKTESYDADFTGFSHFLLIIAAFAMFFFIISIFVVALGAFNKENQPNALPLITYTFLSVLVFGLGAYFSNKLAPPRIVQIEEWLEKPLNHLN